MSAILSSLNTLFALYKKTHLIERQLMFRILFGQLIGLPFGYFILTSCSEDGYQTLKIVLGVLLITAAINFLVKACKRNEPSSNWLHSTIGVISGVCTGLFAIGGPPVAYHLYREDMDEARIGPTLHAYFFIIGILRTIMVAADGELDGDVMYLLLTSLLAVPVGVYLGRKYPPKLSPANMRRFVGLLLITLGVRLVAFG